MADINFHEIRSLRDESARKVQEITEKIQELESQLVAFKERVKVYDELIGGVLPSLSSIDGYDEGSSDIPKKRAPRSTKVEMTKRRKIIGEILFNKGEMQPKELLPLVEAKLDYSLEAHHLRAVLRRFTDIFMPCADRHGY